MNSANSGSILAFVKECNFTSGIYCFADKVNSKKNKGKQKKKAAVSGSSPRVDYGYLACQYHKVIVTGLAWIEGFVTTGTIPQHLNLYIVCNTTLCMLSKSILSLFVLVWLSLVRFVSFVLQ